VKLASPEALKLSGTREQSPESFDCYHPRRSVVLGLTVCHDCGEIILMNKDQEDAKREPELPPGFKKIPIEWFDGYTICPSDMLYWSGSEWKDSMFQGSRYEDIIDDYITAEPIPDRRVDAPMGVNESTNTVTMIGVEIAARILRTSGHDLAATRCEKLISAFEMARQWNSLTELEISNLRSLVEAMQAERNKFRVERDLAVERHASSIEDMTGLQVERYALAEQCAKLQIRVNELEGSIEEARKERDKEKASKDKFFWELGQIAMTIDDMGKIEGAGWSDSHDKVLGLVALRDAVNAFVKHVGAPNFKEATDVLLRTKQQDEGKIAEMFQRIKDLGKSRDAYLEDSRQSRECILELKGQLEVAESARDNFRTMLLELCEKMEAGISGAEETKRARAMLCEPMELPVGGQDEG
jgi:hypothetical protein